MAKKALVLGGGAINGGAWAVGMLAGLADAGIDWADADLVIGTSAGAIIGAQLAAGIRPDELFEEHLGPVPEPLLVRIPLSLTLRSLWALLPARRTEVAGRRMGSLALRPGAAPEPAVVDAVTSMLGEVRDWPERSLRLTSLDAATGELRCFDRDSGVGLVSAVAASCGLPGVWAPVTIEGRRWIDGGIRSTANADLAQGYDRVVVLAPIPNGFGPMVSPADQAAALRRDGSQVALVVPGVEARRAYGRDLVGASHRPAAVRAGRTEAAALADRIGTVWHD